MRSRRERTGGGGDIHENDEGYLIRCRQCALQVAGDCGWQVSRLRPGGQGQVHRRYTQADMGEIVEHAFDGGERIGKMVYIILGEGFEEVEGRSPLRRAQKRRRGSGDWLGIGGTRLVAGSHGIVIEADRTIEEIDAAGAELVVVPGGLGGVESILGSQAAMDAVKSAYDSRQEGGRHMRGTYGPGKARHTQGRP